jgi:hypothetical protein
VRLASLPPPPRPLLLLQLIAPLRNFLTLDQFKSFRARDPNHSGYESLGSAINPSYPPLSPVLLNDLNGIWNTLRLCESFSLLCGMVSCRVGSGPSGLSFRQGCSGFRNLPHAARSGPPHWHCTLSLSQLVSLSVSLCLRALLRWLWPK